MLLSSHSLLWVNTLCVGMQIEKHSRHRIVCMVALASWNYTPNRWQDGLMRMSVGCERGILFSPLWI